MNPVQTDIQRTNALNAAGLSIPQQNAVIQGKQLQPKTGFQQINLSPISSPAPTFTPPVVTKPSTNVTTVPTYNTTASTTAISNSNKIDQVPGIVSKTNALSDVGVRTDPQTGVATYANGLAVPQKTPEQLANESAISDYDKQIMTNIDSLQASSDASTASLIQNIKDKYVQRRAEQSEVNRQQNNGITNALLMGGVTGAGSSSQYAPISSEGIISLQESYGIKQLASLTAEENDLIAAALAAKASNDFKILDMKNQEIEKKRAEKMKVAEELNKSIAETNKKIRENTIQASRDNALANLVSQGITDPSQLLTLLNGNGGDFTLKEVKDTLANTGILDIQKDINSVVETAAKNGATFDVLQKVGNAKNKYEAMLIAGPFMKTAKDPLEDAYKQAQIDKIYADINSSSGVVGAFGGDAFAPIAYAQQYAATGNIPTGLPKGTFGVISQIAKELPKQKGELFSSVTGVKSTSVPTTVQDDISRLYNITEEVKKLKELDKERSAGILAGTGGYVFGSDAQAKYLTSRKTIVDNISRMQSGAALTADEVAFYEDYLPSRFSESLFLGQDSGTKINNFEEVMNDRLKNALANQALVIYGYSKVQTPAGEKTVGETITGPNGMSARVNADGTVTEIQGTTEQPQVPAGQTIKTGPTSFDEALQTMKLGKATLPAVRNNNPGNIKASTFTKSFPGVAGVDDKMAIDGGKFLKFESPQAGFNAAKKLFTSSIYANLTVNDALKKWSNFDFKALPGYDASIAPEFAKAKVKDLPPEAVDKILLSMFRKEGFFA